MPPKRRHTKSRNGCMTCRRRRVKCDEIRPICANCTRRELDCIYAACCPPGPPDNSCAPSFPSASSATSATSASTSSGSSSPPSQQIVSPRLRVLPLQQFHTPASTKPRRGRGTGSSAATPLTALVGQLDSILLGTRSMFHSPLLRISLSRGDLDNMSLLHHFTIRTYGSLANDRSAELYRTEIPKIALQSELTMHSLLAVTALHRSLSAEASQTASQYRIIAAGHYDLALRALRTAIRERAQRGDAILAASTMIVFYSFACKITGSEADHVPRVIGWIPLLQGVQAIIKEWWVFIRQSDLRPLFDQLIKGVVDDGDFLTLPASLFDLVREIPPTSDTTYGSGDDDILDGVRAAAYKRVLDHLRKVWNNFWTTGYKLATAFQWISHAPSVYIHDLQLYKPRALVIFCYFLCMIKKLDGFWWVKGSAEETFVDIERKLGTRWKSWLEWPKGIIMGDCEVVGEEPLI